MIKVLSRWTLMRNLASLITVYAYVKEIALGNLKLTAI